MKTYFKLIAFALLLIMAGSSAKAASVTPAIPADAQTEQRIQDIQARAEAIKAMDKSQLSKADRTELKQELKNMKHEIGAVRRTYILVKLIVLVVLIVLLIVLL